MNHHLTEEEISVCSETLAKGSYDQIPADIREHLSHCDQCAEEVLMVIQIAGDEVLKTDKRSNSPGKIRRIGVLAFSVAASVAFIIMVFQLFFWSDGEGQDENLLTHQEQDFDSGREPSFNKPDQENDATSLPDTAEEDSDDAEPAESEAIENGNNGRESRDAASNKALAENKRSGSDDSDPPKEGDEQKMPAATAMPPAVDEDPAPDTLHIILSEKSLEALEDLVQQFRGQQSGEEVLHIARYDKSSILVKRENSNGEPVELRVLDASGSVTAEKVITDEESILNDLDEEFCYWKVISGKTGDLVFCDKVYLKEDHSE
ncbi:MAG: hypothetical protein ACQEQ0_02615 [Bacteroidota bacterium]